MHALPDLQPLHIPRDHVHPVWGMIFGLEVAVLLQRCWLQKSRWWVSVCALLKLRRGDAGVAGDEKGIIVGDKLNQRGESCLCREEGIVGGVYGRRTGWGCVVGVDCLQKK